MLGVVLDTLATHPGERWSSRDFGEAGLTRYPFAALGALTMKIRAGFGRNNIPVIFEQVNGTWAWSLPDEFAAHWRASRGLPKAGPGPASGFHTA